MTPPNRLPKADYGLDAPGIIRNLAIFGVLEIAVGLGLSAFFTPSLSWLATVFYYWGLLGGLACLLTSALMVWSSKVGKYRERERLLDLVQLKGTEKVLDVGCGRGLVLNAAARRLTTGKAVGLDLWQAADQSGNSPDTARANAEAEGVSAKVEIKSGDMRKMPFTDSSFDVVVSSLAIHNVFGFSGRSQAIREIDRVTKAGGRLALLDFQRTEEYVHVLNELGWKNITRSPLHFGMFPPVRIVTATKAK
jgi:arsenite methyltransferase